MGAGSATAKSIVRTTDIYLIPSSVSSAGGSNSKSISDKVSSVEKPFSNTIRRLSNVFVLGQADRRGKYHIVHPHFDLFQLPNWRWESGIGARCRARRTARRRPPQCAARTASSTRTTATCARGPAIEVCEPKIELELDIFFSFRFFPWYQRRVSLADALCN